METVLQSEEAAQTGAQPAEEQIATLWCDRRAEISELLALVARSLRPIYLVQSSREFDELLGAVDQSSSNADPDRSDKTTNLPGPTGTG